MCGPNKPYIEEVEPKFSTKAFLRKKPTQSYDDPPTN